MRGKRFEFAKKRGEETSPDKKEQFSFYKEIIESVKKTARIIALATAATVVAVSCHNSTKYNKDAEDIVEIEDSHTEDIIDDTDIPDIIEEDIVEDEVDEPEAEISCSEGSPLEGEVSDLISTYDEEHVHFNGPAGESVDGTAEITLGGDVNISELLILGDCPDETNTIAAFGVQGTSLAVTPSWRIDVIEANAEMPEIDADFCPPPEEEIAISMFNDSVNTTVIRALIGSVEGSVETEFSNVLSASVYDGDTETTSPIALTESGYIVKMISVLSEDSRVSLASTIHSNTGEELSSSVLEETIVSKTSKTLKVSQLGPGNSILPDIGSWTFEGLAGPEGDVYICLRPCEPDPATTPVDKTAEISGIDITPMIINSCGKMFAAFDIISVDAAFNAISYPPTGIEPFHLSDDYSLRTGHYGDGLNAMDSGDAKLYVQLRRRSTTVLDSGDRVELNILVTATVQSRDDNPATGEKDTQEISFNIRLIVPSGSDYSTVCGCDASLP